MFVINSNTTNDWYSNTSINGIYNPPMDGSTYSLFSCACSWCRVSCGCVRDWYDCCWAHCNQIYDWWWNWCCDNASSLFSNYKANFISDEILFPYNYEQSISWYQFFFGDCFCMEGWKCCGWTSSVQYVPFSLEPKLMHRVVSNKVFDAWVCVWKTLNWVLKATVCVRGIYDCCNNPSCNSYSSLSWPMEYYVDMWLIHQDWSKTSILCCAFETWWSTYDWVTTNIDCFCWHWYSYCVSSSSGSFSRNPFVEIMGWIINTQWATTQAWDRIYFDFWRNCFDWCLKYICCTPYSWTISFHYYQGVYIWQQTIFTKNYGDPNKIKVDYIPSQTECPTLVYLPLCCWMCNRSTWIQFSIE